jgi:hypothetical protein
MKQPAEEFDTGQASRRKNNRWNSFWDIHAAKLNCIDDTAFAGMKKGLEKAFSKRIAGKV